MFDGRRSEEIHGRWDGSRDSSPDGSRWICYENRLINKKIQNLGRKYCFFFSEFICSWFRGWFCVRKFGMGRSFDRRGNVIHRELVSRRCEFAVLYIEPDTVVVHDVEARDDPTVVFL